MSCFFWNPQLKSSHAESEDHGIALYRRAAHHRRVSLTFNWVFFQTVSLCSRRCERSRCSNGMCWLRLGFRPVFVASSSRSLVEIKISHDKMEALSQSIHPQTQLGLLSGITSKIQGVVRAPFFPLVGVVEYFLGCGIDRQTMEVVTETMSLYLGLLVRTMESRFHTQEGLPKKMEELWG